MAQPIIDLRAPKVTIKLTRGTSLTSRFFYLGEDNSLIDLTGFTPILDVIADDDTKPIDWQSVTNPAAISIGIADVNVAGLPIVGAGCFIFNITDEITASASWDRLRFSVKVGSPTGDIKEVVSGEIQLS
jgi:hypothetical protein